MILKMSFEQKLKEQFESLNISVINESKNLYHLYADYVELVCLISNEFVSSTQFSEKISSNNENGFSLGKEIGALGAGAIGAVVAARIAEALGWAERSTPKSLRTSINASSGLFLI